MTVQTEPHIDAASALWQGQRALQQDVLATDFPIGSDFGLALLADGMGGHPAGDLAARIAVTEVFADLKLRGPELGGNTRAALRRAVQGANHCIAAQAAQIPALQGMGTTFLALVIEQGEVQWLSVGDSLLFLWRAGQLRLLNTRHCLAEDLDRKVRSGEIGAEDSLLHPDRHALTACLNGDEIARIDCPEQSLALLQGDLLLLASDGIETISRAEISAVLAEQSGTSAATIAKALLHAVIAKDAAEQDNLSLTVICALPQTAARAQPPAIRERLALWRQREASSLAGSLAAAAPQ